MTHRRTIRLTSLLAAAALVLSACVAGDPSETTAGPGGTTGTGGNGDASGRSPKPAGSSVLVAFDACDQLLEYAISHAVDIVGAYGLDDYEQFWPIPTPIGSDMAETSAASGRELQSAGDGPSFSGTNVQVLGVDEPDIVKTDGKRIVVLADGSLIVADVTGEEPQIIGRARLDDHTIDSMFLSGDKVLLLGSGSTGYRPVPAGDAEVRHPGFTTPTAQFIEVDISGDPEIVRVVTIDGRFISGRMIGDSVRLVLESGPVGLEWSYPKGTGLSAERKAAEENREIVRNSEADNWIPHYIVTDSSGDVTDSGTLLECGRASHPKEFSGLNMLSVVTIDFSEGLDIVDSTGVMANGDTVYASEESLYVATRDWRTWQWGRMGEGDEPDAVTTEIHKFDTRDPQRAVYRASGVIDGYLLDQFAMDERDGVLRTASTTQPLWSSAEESESMVTTLRDEDGELTEIGRVDGLGKTERIYSVRFMGDMGYVVTFRETDPLYTVDLSDPAAPKVAGELKIMGYSAYLHPLSDGLLLGVGQDATETGALKGSQVSVFDVSDPSNPKRVDQHTLSKESYSEVEHNHHAFLYWGETGLALIPVVQYSWEGSGGPWHGAIGLMVGDDGDIGEVNRVEHPGGDDDWGWEARVVRSMVIGESVYTLSGKGIMKSSLDGLKEQAFLDF